MEAFIGLTLSSDPLFLSGLEHVVVDELAGDEEVAEKFQALLCGEALLLFYENRLRDGTWRTAMRRYAVQE